MFNDTYFEIYNKLGDELSRNIFLQRIIHSFSGGFANNNALVDWVSLMRKSVLNVFNNWDLFLQQVKKGCFNSCSCYIFGTSNCGKTVLNELKKEGALNKINLCGYLDNFKTGVFNELPIVTPKEINTDSVIIIANFVKNHSLSITKQLIEAGFKNVYHFLNHDLLSGKEYFDFFKPSVNEVFVDAGCFDGDTSINFINWCKGNYNKIYAFEAVSSNFNICEKALKPYNNISIINKGLYERNGEMQIFLGEGQPSCNSIEKSTNTANSWVNYNQTQIISICRLDDEIKAEIPTFIKLDIEGSELAALYGAEKTIKNNKPKLAVSVYHKPSDILDIPLLLLQLNPNYTFFLRHYSPFAAETDLYAIDNT